MGGNERWEAGVPNGLLAGADSVMRELDLDRWLRVEERTAELIACIQPNQVSEERRNAVAVYVQRLIRECFPCQVCTFGSVPLKTYLPDGDIDLTAFCENDNLKDTWANQVRDMLESEEKNENAEFHVKEVQYIQAEVKIIKCLVENIVVDISFNQVGGLCTLCFLDQVDSLISRNHLFKRSIILIKAWCYYESRILGAHHGLISTYALETLVLYIFHVFNSSFHGPLEVLFRFLEFFSKFDWDNFCLSLWGPVPISSLPDVTAEHPRKDGGELLLSKLFLDACSLVYAVYPGGQENNGQPFISKHFNVIDPLRVSNNLGRSVSKGNFFRIRSAFAFGAKKLARLLDCPKENLIFEVNQFFMNTWERHGSGHRPDAPGLNSWRLGLSNQDHLQDFNNTSKNTREEKVNGMNKMEGNRTRGSGVSSKQGKSSARMMPMRTKSTAATQTHNLKCQFSSLMISDQNEKQTATTCIHSDEVQRDLRADHLVNNRGRFLFSRTHSSPELTDEFDVSSQPRRSKAEAVNAHIANNRLESSHRKNNLGSESLANHSRRSLVEDNSSMKHPSSQRSAEVDPDSDINTNSRRQKFGVDTPSDEFSPSVAQMMHREGQDLANFLASASLQGFNNQVHVPFPSGHLPYPFHPSFLASMGYGQRNLPGFLPANIPLIDHSFQGMQFPQGLVSPQMAHYFPGVGLNMPSDDSVERSNENFGSVEMKTKESASDFGQEKDLGSPRGYDPDNGKLPQSDNKPAASSNSIYIPPFRLNAKVQQKHSREKGGSLGKNIGSLAPTQDISSVQQRRDIRSNEVYVEERSASSRLSSASRSNSLRSSSEGSWDGSVKMPKSTKEKRGKKVVPTDLAASHGKGKIMSEHVTDQTNDSDQAWCSSYSVGSETAGRNLVSEPIVSLQVRGHHIPDSEVAQTSESDSVTPFAPMFIGHDSRQRTHDSNGLIAFYPTGPPIPFVTMLPIYNVPPERGSSDASRAHFGDDAPSDNSISGRNFSSRRYEQSEDLRSSSSLQETTIADPSEERNSDILNSDFASHWQNLQFGRLCQQPRHPGLSNYPSSLMVPPVYLQGQFPYDNTWRPLATSSNMFSQPVSSYGHHPIPVSPQSASSRPPNAYQQYMDEMPRYRSGTGTYLPDPKVSLRERQSSGTRRRGNYNHDRNDNYGDREGNWHANSRSRGAARGYGRTQTDRSNSRSDRLGSSEGRADRAWSSHRHDSTSYQSENGPLHQNGPESLPYNMYASGATNPNGLSNGHVQSVMMAYHPFDQNGTYNPHGEQLEFDSLSPVGLSGRTEELEPNEGTRSRTYDDHRVNRNSRHRFSPDQPTSPRHQRRI